MPTHFTVIVSQRQHLGDDPGVFNDVEPELPLAGSAKSLPFDCPGIDPGETAFLMFQSRDVDHRGNILLINGVNVFGGLPVNPARNGWNANIVLIEPRHQLKEKGNVLHVESRTSSGESGGEIDDFIIDNVLIVYKML